MKRNPRSTHPKPDTDPVVPPPLVEPEHPVLLAAAEHLRQHDYSYSVMSSGKGLLFTVTNGEFTWVNPVQYWEDKSVLRFTARLPLLVPATRRRDLALLLMRLSHGNLIGTWQMDPADGEVLYISNHLCGEQIPSEEEFRRLLLMTTGSMVHEGGQIIRHIQRLPRPRNPERN